MNSKVTPEKKAAFLAALAATCSVRLACEAADISRKTVYLWREADDKFAAGWRRAKMYGAEALEDEAVRRAVEGYDEPLYYQGIAVGTVRKYSDKLLTLLLQGALPEKYNMNKFKPVDFVTVSVPQSPKLQKTKRNLAELLEEFIEDEALLKKVMKDVEDLV